MAKSSIQAVSVTNVFWWQWAYTFKWQDEMLVTTYEKWWLTDCSYIITLSRTWNPFYTLWQISELGYCSITHQKVTFPVVTAMGTSNLTLRAYYFSKYDAFAHKKHDQHFYAKCKKVIVNVHTEYRAESFFIFSHLLHRYLLQRCANDLCVLTYSQHLVGNGCS